MAFKLLLAFTLVGLALGLPSYAIIPKLVPSADKFERFIKDFKLNIADPVEKALRMNIFNKNLDKINLLNADGKHGSAVFGVNKFSHLTFEEFKKQMLMSDEFVSKNYNSSNSINKGRAKRDVPVVGASPASFDWRSKNVIGPIRNQENCGCCWSFATTAAVEAQIAITGGGLVDLSEQELVSCESKSNGCDGGMSITALEYVRDKGLHLESAYPYKKTKETCPTLTGETRKIMAIDDLTGMTEEQMKDYLAANGPFVISFGVVDSFQHYQQGVYTEDSKLCGSINHAMLAVGYGVDENNVPYWIVKNQWGTDWGESGYIRIKRNANTCCMGGCGFAKETIAPRMSLPTTTKPTTTPMTTTPAPMDKCRQTREVLVKVWGDNTTFLTNIIGDLNKGWKPETQQGFKPYFDQIKSAIWGTANSSSESKINAIVNILKSYKANTAVPHEMLFEMHIQIGGYPQISIQEFVDCGPYGGTTSTTASTTTKMPVTTTSKPPMTTTKPPMDKCRESREVLVKVWGDNSTYLTNIIGDLNKGWKPETQQGFKPYFDQIKSAIWGTANPTLASKINAIVNILKSYKANNSVPHEMLFELHIQIGGYPQISIQEFVDCGPFPTSK